jgi:hypothetical protein
VVTAEAVAQTDEYTLPLLGQLKAEAQELREQLSKLAGGRCTTVVSAQPPCSSNNSATRLAPKACTAPISWAYVVIWEQSTSDCSSEAPAPIDACN